ncbi:MULTISPECIES: hypothetical protein [unclassified Vibrio]
MKRFFPSNIMLIPFVVKNYSEEQQEDSGDTDQQSDPNESRDLEE